MRSLLCTLALVVASTAFAQTQSTGIPATVEGRLVNSVTGAGIANATIRLVPMRGMRAPNDKSNDLQTSTQADGSFHVDQIAPGAYMLVPASSGFSVSAKSGPSRYVDLQEGQLTNGLVVQMMPDTSLVGRVLDNEGNPVPNARVFGLLPSLYGDRNSYDERGSATADQNGVFSLNGLPRGHYYIAAEFVPPKAARAGAAKKAQAADKPQPADEAHFVPTFYPRALSLADATVVTADPEQPAGTLTLYLQRASTHVIRGKIGDVGAVSDLTVQLSSRDLNINSEVFAPTAAVAPDRTFSISNVLPGSYTLRLLNKRRRLLAREDLDAGSADVSGMVLSPLPPISIRGAVDIESSGVPSASPTLTVMARPLDNQVRAGVQTVQSNADGTFLFQRLDPGLYSFRVLFRSGSFYVHSIEFNGQDVTNRTVDLAQTGSGQMEVRISNGVAQVDGSIEDAASAEGSARLWIVLIPEQIAPDAANVRVAIAKPDGTFTLPSIPPGSYQILAADQADPRLWQNPRFLTQIRSQGTSLSMAENDHAQMQLHKVPYPLLQQTAEQLGIYLE